ncbi:uncharacterized protein si:ch211-113e8.11 [Cebidichthys violaceus]|uniref:uncharacterized protein si:ch211-113e8.11 n=1 Tax=Cebidichthys violaceus TaxID=271503 RepID=UPI0035CB8FDF
MNSLVGYGVSSESDSDGDVKDANNGGVCSFRETGGEASAVKKTRNFLLESGSASSESDPEEEDPEPSSLPPHPQKPASSAARRSASPSGFLASHKLPPPSLNTSSDSGVFANPFKAQADRKLSALQKHVPLTMQAKPSQIGGKKVCVSYRKNGRCRFGIKCKFAHDSDLQTLADSHPPVSEETPGSGQAESRAGGSRGGASQNLPQTKEEEESGGQQVKKRKVGLSNTLIPPKRAMKQYTTQRDREQINMS